jgi:hypothetical protein
MEKARKSGREGEKEGNSNKERKIIGGRWREAKKRRARGK